MGSDGIPPIAVGDRVGEVANLLNAARGDKALHDKNVDLPALNVHATIVRNRDLYQPALVLAQYLAAGMLMPRDRELIALRVAVRCVAAYVWAHHCHAARAAGVSDEEIGRVAGTSGAWNAREKALFDAVDELHTGAVVREKTWRVLNGHYCDAELIELVIVIGEYRKIACFVNTMNTPVENWLPPTPSLPRL